MNNTQQAMLDVAIVGAGFSGLYLLDQLRQRGFRVRVIDAADGPGGIWQWNCYPGARVDSPCWIYQYSNESIWREWEWGELFPGHDEMRAYFDFVDEKLDLSRDIDFSTWVKGASFDEGERSWTLETEHAETGSGSYQARFVVVCTGFGSPPYIPPFEGLDSFQGICHHTALWPKTGVDFAGQRVAVVGTGASGVQVAQEAAREAASLTVFQRTPNLCLPMGQRQLTAEDNERLRESYEAFFTLRDSTFGGVEYDFKPQSALDVSREERDAFYESLWQEGGFKYWLATYEDIFQDEQANLTAYEFWRDKVCARIDDPEVAAKLAPDEPPHPFGVKRPSLEQWYYDIFNQDNVTLVDVRETPIKRFTTSGIETSTEQFEFDVIALATGFDAVTGAMTMMNIKGRDGSTLKDKWADGVRTYQGLTNHGYPNLLASYGPQAPTGFCNGPSSAEYQGDIIVEFLEHMRDHELTRIEPTQAAEEAWRTKCLELAEPTLFPKADSWYMGANIPGKKKEMLMFPGGLPMYLDEIRQCIDNDYAGYELS